MSDKKKRGPGRPRTGAIQKSVSLPANLWIWLDAQAKEQKKSRSQFIADMIRREKEI